MLDGWVQHFDQEINCTGNKTQSSWTRDTTTSESININQYITALQPSIDYN